MALTIVPVPGVKPGAPYSICQLLAPPVVQLNVIEVVVLAVLAIAVGFKHVGALSISISSIAQSACVEVNPNVLARDPVKRTLMVSPAYELRSITASCQGSPGPD